MSERSILIAAAVLISLGVTKSELEGTGIDKPVIGGLLFVLLLSLFANAGKTGASFAAAFAWLVAGTVVLVNIPEIVADLKKGK